MHPLPWWAQHSKSVSSLAIVIAPAALTGGGGTLMWAGSGGGASFGWIVDFGMALTTTVVFVVASGFAISQGGIWFAVV